MYGRVSFLRNTKLVGDIAEAHVIAACVEAGYHVSIPFGENHRYDLVLEREGSFLRIQVKSGRVRRGVVIFNCYSSHSHRGGPACRRYAGEADFFGVYCAENNEVYLVPVAVCGLRGALRLVETQNRQQRKIRWAEPYRMARTGTKVVGAKAVDGVSLPGLLPL